MKLGDTYFRGVHLWVVSSLPDDKTGAVVLVNFTEHRDNKDKSCVVDVGDHPYITKKSVVEYRRAWVCTPEEQASLKKSLQMHEAVSPELLQRIQNGTDSDFIPQKAQALVQASYKKQQAAKKAEELAKAAGSSVTSAVKQPA